ncbi:MAG: HDOD domain-containing protein [Chloroflexi bacterium]|nr:HDOD domain-containing protein [Chloroflexota bacterium]MDA1240000.1 HDOD domain-containing protein [Chloroflexota bacterium]
MSEPGAQYPQLDLLVGEIAGTRSLTPVAARVPALSGDGRFSAHELAQAISSDPALTARVLRLANSPYFSHPRRIGTIRDAVVLLGFHQIRAAALALSVVNGSTDGESAVDEHFWRYSLTVGLVAEVLAHSEPHEAVRPEDAFMAGLLHCIGRLAIQQVRPRILERATLVAGAGEGSVEDAQRSLFGYTDAEVGGALLLEWGFAPVIALAVARWPRCVAQGADGPDYLPAIVARAHDLTVTAGLSDGIIQPAHTAPTCDSSTSPLGPLLEQAGGMDGLARRVSVFIETVSAGH